MVFFSCDHCNESLKKNQVEKHSFHCRSASYSCIDCQQHFDRYSYAQHLKCISEDQKYGGKNFVAKENKGETKQNVWVDQVDRAIEAVKDRQLKELLQRIQGFANIPRKEAKFINFLVNSIKIRNRDLCSKAWAAIAEEAAKIKKEEEEMKKAAAEEKKKEEDEKKVEEKSSNGVENGETTTSFKWKATIKRKLKENGGEMKVKKLRTAVLDEYEGEVEGNDLLALFDEKIQKAGIVVDGKKASLK
ncbi:hypothetical protein PENTCL1PPCAC_10889 [Pristionchus entomophagus]|uniref:Zinc finger C2H2 LYAR-type domain-containing protein n=1 Tax=Pristionchus entomophagus TaxID=358040 RepID=A0AAV5T0I3_9BILA|nr:hypothetical protein PENTCL1PPCAC_10889 [Pristionchus entomophagus]